MTQLKNVLKDNYNIMLLNDYLREEIKEAGFSRVEISKTPVGTKITLFVTRPGIVIGRKGANIKSLTDKLESDFGLKNPQLLLKKFQIQTYHQVSCVIEWLFILNVVLHLEERQCGQFNK